MVNQQIKLSFGVKSWRQVFIEDGELDDQKWRAIKVLSVHVKEVKVASAWR